MLSATKFQISNEDQESNRSRVLQDILSQSQFLDVTLVNDDREWGAHKLILSTVSPVLRRILDRGPQHHPLLYLRGTKSSNIEALLNFVYYGETSVPVADLNEFISLGNDLQLAGICEKWKEHENNEVLKSEPIQANEHSNDSQKAEMQELEGQDEESEMSVNNCKMCDFRGFNAESLEKHLNLIHSGIDSKNKSNKALAKIKEQSINPLSSENQHNENDPIDESSYSNNTILYNRKKRKDSSPVWLCAVKLSSDMSQCKICKKNITTHGGSTSNIAGHLSSKHSDVKEVIEVQTMLLEKNPSTSFCLYRKKRDRKYEKL